MPRTPIRIVDDHWGDPWAAFESRDTGHGWPLLLGRPPHSGYAAGGDRTILTTELVEYLTGQRHDRGTVCLPIGKTAITRIRKLLGLNIYDDMRQWWEEHAEEMAAMTETAFAEKHGYSIARVSLANKAIFGRRIRDVEWWMKEPAASLLRGDGPRALVAEELEISIGAVGRLRWVLRQSDPIAARDSAKGSK